jgi:hypothetical protein
MSWRAEVPVTEVGRTSTWDATVAAATVVVATCDRADWVPELLRSLAQQDIPLEVVLVDDASAQPVGLPDDDLPVLLLRTAHRAGPSAARNAGAARRRTGVVLLTDDDCLPSPGWARALRSALDGRGVVQGRTEPMDEPHGPWDRAITVTSVTGLWETCNLGLDATAFEAAGGFADLGLLPGTGARGFGEDAELGARLARAHGSGYVDTARVRHRWVAGDYRDHLRGRARLQGFPGLVRHVPELPLIGGVGLSRRNLVTDVGVLGLAAAAVLPWAAVAAAPWVVRSLREAGDRPGRPRVVRAAQLAAADAVGMAGLLRGSLRARRLVL